LFVIRSFVIPPMFGSPRIRLKPLANLCHRLATATNAGLEDRRIWRDEAQRGSATQRYYAGIISEELAATHSLAEALRKTDEYFPPLFRQMVEVGETSGQLGEIYKRLGRNYDQMVAAKRAFWSKLTWPMLQLVMALGAIGVLIWIMGMLPVNRGAGGTQVDLLGFGLIGNRGLVIYVAILAAIAGALWVTVEAARRRTGWALGIETAVLRIPVLGDALKTLCMSRFTWVLHLVFDTPMDLRKALPLALSATGSDYFAKLGPEVARRIEQGQSITVALAETGQFPSDLLDSLAVGEESGSLVETMKRQAAEYEERSSDAISLLAQFAGYGIWVLVVIFLIFMIMRLFASYIGMLESVM